jgi:hypothetical protein
MTPADMAATVSGARRSGEWRRCVCPVHGSRTGRSLTLALRDGDLGLVLCCHAGCRRDRVIAHIQPDACGCSLTAVRKIHMPLDEKGGRRAQLDRVIEESSEQDLIER